MNSKLSYVERVILRNQYRILSYLDEEPKRYRLLEEAVANGFEGYEFDDVNRDIVSREQTREVVEILEMYYTMDHPLGSTEFPGWDLNDDVECQNHIFTEWLVKRGQFKDMKGIDQNSHGSGPGLYGYRRMLSVFKEEVKIAKEKSRSSGSVWMLTPDQVKKIQAAGDQA